MGFTRISQQKGRTGGENWCWIRRIIVFRTHQEGRWLLVCQQLTQRPVFHPVRAQLLDQFGEAAHWSASSSATIASMEARSAC